MPPAIIVPAGLIGGPYQIAGLSGGGGGPTFPTLPGLVGRWNALPANVSVSGGNIVSATDLSGNGNNLTPVSGGGNVPYNATGWFGSLGGKPAFDLKEANGSALNATSVPMGTGNSGYAFFVGQMLTATRQFAGAITYGVGGNNDFSSTPAGGCAFLTRHSTLIGIQYDGGVYNSQSFDTISLATNMRLGVNMGEPGGLANFYLNAVSQATSGASGGTFLNGGTVMVGGRYLSGAPDLSDYRWDGPICEVVIGNSTLSSTDLTNLDNYFTAQWGT